MSTLPLLTFLYISVLLETNIVNYTRLDSNSLTQVPNEYGKLTQLKIFQQIPFLTTASATTMHTN